MMTNNCSPQIRYAGFTLVEMMVALFLGFIATIGMYKAYANYSIAADVQDQTLELQQSLRVVMNRMGKEIRMAGYNPKNVAGVGITVANDDELTFTMDITNVTDTNDDGKYEQVDGIDNDLDGTTDENDGSEDIYGDGDTGDRGENITYKVKKGDSWGIYRHDAIYTNGSYCQYNLDKPAANVKPLNFVYLDNSHNVLATPVSGVDLPKIKYIQITLVFRSTNEDTSYSDSFTYKNLQGTQLITAKNDHRRRQCLTAEVNIRNL